MKKSRLILMTAAGLALSVWLAPSAMAGETITLTEEGGATAGTDTVAPTEDSSVNDTFCRSVGEFRGRFAEKLYVQRDFPSNETCVAAIIFQDLKERIGEGRKIVKAKLVLECSNSSGPKPIEAVAYPFIQDWDYNRMDWRMRKHDGKERLWNTSPEHLNLTPAPTTADDVNVYDFAERHGDTAILAYGMRPGTDITTIAESMDAEFDVTKVVKLWYDGTIPNYGWAVVALHPGTYMRFIATNGEGNGPRLVVEVE
ncbi:MAG: DNRLRE domain-containing protein [Lentisphaerae bacterium]|nr:DNRLRE domain-containing protein [Lentisphaerota bacterium]